MESLTKQALPAGFPKINELITQAAPLIFDFNFPFYTDDANERLLFEEQFIRHYYTREIGAETFGWWKLRLQDKLFEVMPRYKQLYDLDQQKYSIYETTTMKRSITGGRNSETNSNSNASSENSRQTDDMYSDTPQGSLTNVKAGQYLSDYRYTDDNSGGSNKLQSTSTDVITHDTTELWSGKSGNESYASIKMMERKAIININKMLIDEFETLFMGVF